MLIEITYSLLVFLSDLCYVGQAIDLVWWISFMSFN